jgi:hypothetical protein
MNAMARSYVSEVTALPAYPCMVFVSHSEEVDFKLTRYDGTSSSFSERQAVIDEIDAAHRTLTERLREVEAQGRDFDPQEDMPDAIRRVDVRVPAADLTESGAVLVDTPGLYTRMKFGYDQMTRDFRDSAACAVFIVKTENLFLEQVFAEFEDLLGLFSRIFLVVNLDSSKRDLLPDGSLAPSLEHDDPQRILDAFEHLSMSAPLKQAADDGRLRIFPVDLLQAASARLRDSSATDAFGFNDLHEDLTEFLNSNEYLQAFMVDSVRRGSRLLRDMRDLGESRPALELHARRERLEARAQRIERALKAIETLSDNDWQDVFGAVTVPLQENLPTHLGSAAPGVEEELHTAVLRWFKEESSLAVLRDQRLEAELAATRGGWTAAALEQLRCRVSGVVGNVVLGPHLRQLFEAAGLSYEQLVSRSLESLAGRDVLPQTQPALDFQRIPVKRRFWDYLLFRSEAKVRRRLFGEARKPERKLSVALKERRLGTVCRDRLIRMALDSYARQREQAQQELAAALIEAFAETIGMQLATRLEEVRERCAEERAAIERSLADSAAIIEMFAALHTLATEAMAQVDGIRHRFDLPNEPLQLSRQPDPGIEVEAAV